MIGDKQANDTDAALPVDASVATLRIYMKSGNVICLPRVVEAEWNDGPTKQMSVTQGGPPGGERIFMRSLDLGQVEAITWEEPTP